MKSAIQITEASQKIACKFLGNKASVEPDVLSTITVDDFKIINGS